jgi:ATP-dependent DNA helicase Q4
LLRTDEEEEMLQKALVTFGYSEFRSGQKEAISRVLKGLSTLVILSTGSGKSLCYQLPAYLYAQKNPGAMAICISPLVSLMEDQVRYINIKLKPT